MQRMIGKLAAAVGELLRPGKPESAAPMVASAG
jgi:hypothetical protein